MFVSVHEVIFCLELVKQTACTLYAVENITNTIHLVCLLVLRLDGHSVAVLAKFQRLLRACPLNGTTAPISCADGVKVMPGLREEFPVHEIHLHVDVEPTERLSHKRATLVTRIFLPVSAKKRSTLADGASVSVGVCPLPSVRGDIASRNIRH